MVTTKRSEAGSSFPPLRSGGDGGELNSPSKQTHRRMYYRLSRCFFLTLQTPTDGILQRWPSDLRRRLEGGYRHRTPRVWRPFPSPRDKDGRTTRHWVLSSESVGSCWFGNYCFVGCLTRVRTDTSACNSSTCLPVETRHPRVKMHWKQM